MTEYIYATNGEIVQNMLSEVFEPLQEIVRCRDCEFLDTDGYCTLLEFWHGDISDKFCAWGERRQP